MDIALFTRQMATMMKAGVPLLQSFDIIGEGSITRTCVSWSMISSRRSRRVTASPRRCARSRSTLMISTATWWTRVSSLAPWRRCSIALRPTRKNRGSQGKDQEGDELSDCRRTRRDHCFCDPADQGRSSVSGSFANFGAELPAFTLMVIGLSKPCRPGGTWSCWGCSLLPSPSRPPTVNRSGFATGLTACC